MSLIDKKVSDYVLITQILIRMPEEYENKADHTKHLINSGIQLTIVDVLGH